jgi:hypothetical protein
MKQRLSITFSDSDIGAYNKHRRDWEHSLPEIPGAIGRMWVQPSLGSEGVGRTRAVPVEREFVEFLTAKGFPFKLEIDGIKEAAAGSSQ